MYIYFFLIATSWSDVIPDYVSEEEGEMVIDENTESTPFHLTPCENSRSAPTSFEHPRSETEASGVNNQAMQPLDPISLDLPWRYPKYGKKSKFQIKEISEDPYFTNDNVFICDFEGYFSHIKKSLVLREFCILNHQTMQYAHYIIGKEPAFGLFGKSEDTSDYCMQNIHHIPDGYATISAAKFKEVADLFTTLIRKCVSKGQDKTRYLSAHFNTDCVNLEDFGAGSYKSLGQKHPSVRQFCKFHSLARNFHCALHKSLLLSAEIRSKLQK